MRTAAILPVKRFAHAKQRLGASIPDPLRLELARAMAADVLVALAQTASVERTIVVTREHSVATAARRQGALIVTDAHENGQSAAVTLGVQRALAEGIERVLCIPGDCPMLDPAELESLLGTQRGDARANVGGVGIGGSGVGGAGVGGDGRGVGARSGGEPEVVIVPDRHGTGTNGLLLTPPDAIAPSFGPGSCERHRELALAAGVACRLARLPSLLLDIDTGADLAALRQRPMGDRGHGRSAPAGAVHRSSGANARASRTRAVLDQPARTDVLSITSTG